MNKSILLRAVPLALCAWAAVAQAEPANPAYNPTYDSTTYDSRYQQTDRATYSETYRRRNAPRYYTAGSTDPAPTYAISDELRQTDLRLGDCLKANGGRMVGRCADLLEQSYRIAGEWQNRPQARQ
jgi:hypothetical protein